MRAIQPKTERRAVGTMPGSTHEGWRVTIAWAKRRVAEAAAARASNSTDAGLLLLAAKRERACGCTIAEVAKIAKTWEG